MKKFLHTRVLPLLLCFTLTLGVVSYETPKAEAVFSETAILTGIACSFLASAGVNLAMNFVTTGAMEQAVSSLLESYCETPEAFQTMCELAASTGISAATGKLYIAKPLVEKLNGFVQWLISEKGVTEGGDAVEVAKNTNGFSAETCSKTSYGGSYYFSMFNSVSTWPLWYDLFSSLGVNSKVAVVVMSATVFQGYFFDSNGVFRSGSFVNPYGNVHASYFGVYDIADLELISAYAFEPYDSKYVYSNCPVFYSKFWAEKRSDFLTTRSIAFDLSQDPQISSSSPRCTFWGRKKESQNSVWNSSYWSFYLYGSSSYEPIDSGVSVEVGDQYAPDSIIWGSSTLSVSAPDDVTTPDTDSMTAPNTYYVTNVNVTNASGKDDFYEKLLALTLENNLTATGEVTDAEEGEIDDTGAGTESGTVVDEESKGFLAYIPQIFEQIKSIPSTIAEKIGELFAPDEALITEITDTFKAKFGFISTLKQLGDDLLSMTPETDPPVIWIHLEDAESEYGYSYGGMVKALDLTWYQKYKADVDRIVSGFLWLLFKRTASIIRGGEMLTEYSNDLTRTYRESASRENEAKFQNWLWRD